jgi:DnaK suppressor protein
MADNAYSVSHARLRARLDAERRQLAGTLLHRIAMLRDGESRLITAQDADEGDPWSLDLRVLELSTVRLHQLEQAIARIDQGGYGRCGQCGASIGEARLAAMPFAVLCRPCAAAREPATGRGGDGRRPLCPRYAMDAEM